MKELIAKIRQLRALQPELARIYLAAETSLKEEYDRLKDPPYDKKAVEVTRRAWDDALLGVDRRSEEDERTRELYIRYQARLRARSKRNTLKVELHAAEKELGQLLVEKALKETP